MGFVYALSNKCFVEDDSGNKLIKIGKTGTTVEQRVNSLSDSTSIPLPFVVEYAVEVEDETLAESILHRHFETFRLNRSREFFYVSLDEVKQNMDALGSSIELPQSREPDNMSAPITVVSPKHTAVAAIIADNPTENLVSIRKGDGFSINGFKGKIEGNHRTAGGIKWDIEIFTKKFNIDENKTKSVLSESNKYDIRTASTGHVRISVKSDHDAIKVFNELIAYDNSN